MLNPIIFMFNVSKTPQFTPLDHQAGSSNSLSSVLCFLLLPNRSGHGGNQRTENNKTRKQTRCKKLHYKQEEAHTTCFTVNSAD